MLSTTMKAVLAFTGLTTASYLSSMPLNAQGLLNESMQWMDDNYDTSAGYLYDFGGVSALRHETRSSVWYAVGLLARNQGSDLAEAERIIANVIAAQFKDPADIWFGDYQMMPEQPEVGSAYYAPVIYNSYDPNWRGFIGTSLVIAMEEFSSILSNDTQALILESLTNCTIGDSYRVGGLNGDNLYASYSNPAIMRAFVSGWVGRAVNDTNMTTAGENYAQEIIDLFTNFNTLSEFNSGTYTGVSLFGLTLWNKYLPGDSIMKQYGLQMLHDTWNAVSQLWHPGMKNMAGPWDRSYGYDMNRYLSLMALWFWTLIGKEKCSLVSKPFVMSHMADYAFAPLMAILAEYHESILPNGTLEAITTFSGERTFTGSAYYPPYDYVQRNITTWLSENLTIGAESFDENVVGGPGQSQEAFNPAVVQWIAGSQIGFISLYPTEMALSVEVSPNQLSLSYPKGSAASIFTLVVSTFTSRTTISGWEDVVGLNVSVSGNANLTYGMSFAGAYGGADDLLRDFEFWNFTYLMPAEFVGTPNIVLDLTIPGV